MGGRKESFVRNKINRKGSAGGTSGPIPGWQAGGRLEGEVSTCAERWEGLCGGTQSGWDLGSVIYRSAGAIREGNISPCQR